MACKTKKCDSFSGKARHRIVIENQSLAVDDYGGSSNAWTSAGSFWAMMKPMNGRDVFVSEQNMSRVTHSFSIRYQSAFANTRNFGSYRISYKGRLFEVKYIRNLDNTRKVEGTAFQEIIAEENGALLA